LYLQVIPGFKKDERGSACSMISMKGIQKVSCGRSGRKLTYIRSSADDRILSKRILMK
jgi:hypothetical protein